ncbi:hypothetical protein [Candidatus Pantoea multigeneris]|uniref:Uncharacterized protein n=1 Tax=Candidatus Pantoea multigeneris TaxID=2608357 RepID=A0ABX0R4E6_9GAMM|nr:hypothetical protein [Pantoea multigeneris]NIF20286.1 hypothetical protein [Pantoea multigeneris]
MRSSAITSNSVHLKCKPEVLESYFHQQVLARGNKPLALDMGIHPSGLSRTKMRMVGLACRLICQLGLPDDCLFSADEGKSVVLRGELAAKLLSMLEHLKMPAEGIDG